MLADWRARFGSDGKLMHHHCKGCANCDDTGLRGRAGIHELMIVSRPMRHLIQTGARADELLRQWRWPTACARCARTASRRCWPGVTTIEEVRANSNS